MNNPDANNTTDNINDTLKKSLPKIVRFSKKIIILAISSVVIFTIVMIVVYVITGSVPDTLVTEFIGFFKIEGGVLGLIKIAETIVGIFVNGRVESENIELGGSFPDVEPIKIEDRSDKL